MDWIWAIVGIIVAWFVVSAIATRLFVREEPTRQERTDDDRDARDDEDVLIIEVLDDD